eukprot:Gb_24919 [translate_table: standard]
MAISKRIVLMLLIGYLAVVAKGDAGFESQESQLDSSNSAIAQELEHLKSKVSLFESAIKEKDLDLRNNEGIIREKESLIEEKSKTIASLQNEIENLQKKEAGDAEAEVTKAHARVSELEKQVEILEVFLTNQKQKQHSLELRASEAENRAKKHSSKYEKMEKVVAEQNARIQKAEQALQIAEETMLKSQAEVKAKAKELMKLHGAWLPPWLAVRLAQFQVFAAARWAEHGKPAMNLVLDKASEKAAAAQDWAKPHVETVKAKWSPILKKQWLQLSVAVAPHVKALKVKAIEVYEVSRDTVSPHLVKAQELLTPHMQTVKELSRPYVDQVIAVSQPHIDKGRVILEPYIKHVSHAYRRFLTSSTKYHHQLQGTVRKTLKKHDITAALATKELVWFLASALLALPVFGILIVYSSIFGSSKKVRKHARSNHSVNVHKKQKRRHVDK